MDAVAGLLDGPRARGAFLLRSTLTAPWALRIEDEAPLTLIAIVRGSAWVEDVAAARPATSRSSRGPDHYTVADDPATAPAGGDRQPTSAAARRDGRELKLMQHFGVRTWGNDPDGETVMLTGTYPLEGEVSGRLLRALPPLLTLRGDRALIGLLAAEIVKDAPGQEAVLDRLLDLLLIATLRAWFARDDAPGWYRAYSDPVVGPALRALHDEPAHPWTVAESGEAGGVSRAALARRFNDLVGEPPMSFLTGWRIALAADLLLEPGATDRLGRGAGRLRQPVRSEHRVQARPRGEPGAVQGDLTTSSTPEPTVTSVLVSDSSE